MKKLKYLSLLLTFVMVLVGGCTSDNNTEAQMNPENEEIFQNDESKSETDQKTANFSKTEDGNIVVKNKEQSILTIHYIDVGQGDSEFIQFPDGESMLIDGGSNNSLAYDYLKKLNVDNITYLVATHPHEDHIGGLSDIINNINIQNIYMPKISTNTKTFGKLLESIQKKGKTIKSAKKGVVIKDKNNTSVMFLGPCSEEYDDINNYSGIVKINFYNNSFIFMGDAEKLSEAEILNADLKADVIKIGHHGSSSSSSSEFIKKVNPKYAVISVGKDNDYGHPHKETVSLLESLNIKTYRTDLLGNILISSDGEKIDIKCDGAADNISSSTSVADKENNETEEMVYKTKTGSKYHRDGCDSLSKSKIPIAKKQAVEQGLEPCKNCNP